MALYIPTAPTIVMQPVGQTASLGQRVSFTVSALGYPSLNYQWRKDGVDIAGATKAIYSPSALSNQAGSYTVVISNSAGSVTSAPPALLTVNTTALGTALAWGSDYTVEFETRYYSGQATAPVAAQEGVTAIAAGGYHTVALKSDGSVVAWGKDENGQTTVPVAAQSGVIAIAAGDSHTVALKNDGAVVAWGNNGAGQTMVPEAGQSGVIAIAAGCFFTMALKNDGAVVAMNYNDVTATPVTPRGQVLSGVAAIAAGGFHTLALKTDGTVVAWGGNFEGQLLVPDGLSGVTAIAAGRFHSYGQKTRNCQSSTICRAIRRLLPGRWLG